MFSQDLLQGLKVLCFQNLSCLGQKTVSEFPEILFDNMFNTSKLHQRSGQISFLVPPRPKFLVNRPNLLHKSIEKCLGSFRSGLGDTQVVEKQEIQPTAHLVCVSQLDDYIGAVTELVGCLTWLNGLVVWASLARANRWEDGHWTGKYIQPDSRMPCNY